MTDLTTEIIEALNPVDVMTIRKNASELHEAMPGVLDMLSSADVKDQKEMRDVMGMKIKEARAHIAKDIADLRAVNKDLEILGDYTKSDFWRAHEHYKFLYGKERGFGNSSKQ